MWFSNMKVAELMVGEVTACSPDDALNRAAQIMWENDCGCVPVIDRAARLIAMLTDRDICMAAYTRGGTLKDIRVSAAMCSELFACRPGDRRVDSAKMMREGPGSGAARDRDKGRARGSPFPSAV